MKDDEKTTVTVTGNKASQIKPERVKYIEEEVAYWRKANAIHAWFVKNVQEGKDDCGDYFVGRDQLKKLFVTCNEVLEASKLVKGQIVESYGYKDGKTIPNYANGKIIKDPSVAEKLLPTESGFFFGGTEYDEYYYQDIKYTRDTLEELLKEEDDGDFSYHSSW
jgi:hypothetical protein